MKKTLAIVFAFLLLAVMTFSVSAEETGWSFAENELWEVQVSFNEVPTAFEAKIYPTDTSVESTIIGNYCKTYSEGYDLRLAEGGIPMLVFNTGGNDNVKSFVRFENAVLAANAWSSIKVEYDASAANCYIDGELKSTVDMTDIPVPTTASFNIVVGGNRIINSDGTHNTSYFRGYIESVSAYVEKDALFSYDFNANGNSDFLIKDLSGKGNNAIFSNVWNTTSGMEDSGEEYAYRFAVVGDPQTISQSGHTQSYLNMYSWIAEQQPDYVITLGDIIQSGANTETAAASAQWQVAMEALGYLDSSKIPHSDIRGNHCSRSQFDKYISYEKYANAFVEQGVKTICYEESMLNCAHLFTVNGMKYMVFALDYGPREDVLYWAGRLCEEYSDYNVIVTTHSYLGRDGTTLGYDDDGDAIEGYGFTTGDEIWEWFVDKHPNIVLVICGHIAHDNVVITQRENSCGTLVTEMLIDFQDLDDKLSNNMGMVNMFNFTEDGKTLYIETYSTANSSYYKNINQIKLTLDTVHAENKYSPSYGEKTAQGAVSGYSYTLYGDTLVISGSGNGVLSGNDLAGLASLVKTIVIENNTAINTIGASFFENYNAVETLIIPETLKAVGSKAFAGMRALKTVAYFNDYYSESFVGDGIIDIRSIQTIQNDSLEGSAANASAVYLSRYGEIRGQAMALVSGDATYYTYPSGKAAQYVRSLGSAVNHSYYTFEMTGDPYLAVSGTAYMNGANSTQSTLNWSFDLESQTLRVTQGNCNSLRMHGQGMEFENWKKIWNDVIKSISMGAATYSQWESFECTHSVTFGLTELETIIFDAKLDIDDRTPETGWFEGCVNLKSMRLKSEASLEDGIIDLSWWKKIRGNSFQRMFKDCTSIKEIIFPETMELHNNNQELIFRVCQSMFENCVNLERITLPHYTASIEANAFAGCDSLSEIHIESIGFTVADKSAFPDQNMTIYVKTKADKETIDALGYENTKVVIDLREAIDIKAAEFANTSAEIWLGNADGVSIDFSGVSKTDAFTFVSYPTCDAADDVRTFIKKSGSSAVKLTYYSEEFDSTLVRSGAQGTGYTWTFDETTGILTIACTKAAELAINNNNTAFIPWKAIWRDAISKIQITGETLWNKMQINHDKEGFFEYLPNLEAVLMSKKIYQWQVNVGSLFEGCTSLTTFDFGSSWDDVEYGVIDLSGATNVPKADYLANMFNGCSSITAVNFPTTNFASTHIGINMFKDCTSLVSITLPATITNISEGAFDGCINLRSIVLVGETVPADLSGIQDIEGFMVICSSADMASAVNTAGGWEYTKAVFFDGSFDGNINMDGFSIRTKKYNGIRGMFSFNLTENAILEATGYALVEYGAIAISKTAYTANGGIAITLNDGVYKVNAGQKIRVYDAQEGFCRDDGTATLYKIEGDTIKYNVSVVNYTSNFNSDIYMCAYSVYTDPNGETLITYKHYSDDYKFFNLYDVTLSMYKAGAINASISDDAAVWNTLLTGAVTIASGDIYKEIPAVGYSSSNGYKPSSTVTLTLVLDTDDVNYVAIYRGEGAIPAQHDSYNSYSYSYGETSANQLGPTISTYSPADGYDPIPILSEYEVTLVKTIIMDHGITSISKYGFVGLDYAETYVYPTTLESVAEGAFFYNRGVTTAYCAHVENPNKKNEIGLFDFSSISGTYNLTGAIRDARSLKKVHFPQNVTNANASDAFGTSAHYGKMSLTKMWFGSNTEPADGVVDMSNITVSAIGSQAFMCDFNLTTLIIPEGCSTVSTTAFNGAKYTTYDGVIMGNFKTIKQPNYVAEIAKYCNSNGLEYVNYKGEPLTASQG